MKKKKLRKDIRKSITHSIGRFISIMLLMMLGSFALIGLFVTGPDMRKTGINYFKKYNTADLSIICDYGITKTEQDAINKASGIKDIEYIYLKDVVIKDTNTSVRVFSKPDNVSLYELKEGKLPTEENEIAIDYNYKDKYKINSNITFTEKKSSDEYVLKRHTYKVVGYIYSSEILSYLNKGETTVGTGALDTYAITIDDNFNSDVYMMAKLTFKDTNNLDPYSDTYTDKITKHKEELNKLLKEKQDIRLESIKEEYQKPIDEAKEKLNSAKKKLKDTKEQLNSAYIQINNAKEQIKSGKEELNKAKNKIDSASKKINQSEKTLKEKQQEYDSSLKEYNKKLKEYETSKKQLDEKEKELNKAKEELKQNEEALNTGKEKLEKAKTDYDNAIIMIDNQIEVINKKLEDTTLTDEEKTKLEEELNNYTIQKEEVEKNRDNYINTVYTPSIKQLEIKEQALKEAKEELKTKEQTLNENKTKLSNAKKQLEEASKSLNEASKKINQANTTLKEAKEQLNTSKIKYNNSLKTLNDSEKKLKTKETEYNTKLKEFNEKEKDANKEIEEKEQEVNDAQDKIDNLDLPTYSVYTRREAPGSEGYMTYTTISEIIDSLAKIFPVFLYFVAALVTLTTMTRFVNEERINSGTLKSLGYEDRDIIKKFTIYGLIAGTTGTVIGIILGHTLLPSIVYNAYKMGFSLPKIEFHFYPLYTFIAIILSLCSSVIPPYIVSKKELQERPADLLLPKAPKAGTKILLERIKPIWNRMSFTHKVTARNIFRYKSRMLMTIFGVAGATSILFTGFSVRASISKINQRQFSEIIKYNMIVAKNSDLEEDEENDYEELINSDEVKSYSSIYYESASITAGDKNDEEEIKLIAVEEEKDFDKYIDLVNRKTKKHLDLDNDGVIISERLADLLNAKVGDTISYMDSKEQERKVKVSGICEMYTGHFIFMNKEEYNNTYDDNYQTNADLVLLKNKQNTEKVSAEFMKLSSVKGIVSNTTLYNQIETIVKSLNKIMTVLTIVAALLSIVIIYNLTNINVSERIRELSTIKVLGFRDKEVTMYIYRETIILTLLAIVFGWIIGIALHSYILKIVPPDEVMFNPDQWIGSFMIPFAIITIVSVVMGIYVHRRLKNVDMLEALKSVD